MYGYKKFAIQLLRWLLVGAVTVLVSCSDESSPIANKSRSQLEYNLGDVGPGGGIIVYSDEAGFNNSAGEGPSIGVMCLIGTCHYLEMAKTDLYGFLTYEQAIIAASDYTTPQANDWLLPSKDALNALYEYSRSFDTDFPIEFPDYYWSATKDSIQGFSWSQGFSNGVQDTITWDTELIVRPVRAF